MTDCDNWGGVTLLTCNHEVDNMSKNKQARYRQGRNTTEQIFVLRNIIEQVIEWNSNLFVCFVDFEKASGSVHRETLWKLLKSYGIPDKLAS